MVFCFFQAEDGIRDGHVTGVQTCALPIWLLEISNRDDPRSEWVLRLPVAVWDLLHRGQIVPVSLPASLTYRPADSFPELTDVVLGGELGALAQRLPELVRTGALSAVVLRGMDGSGRLTLLGAVARRLGQPVLVHDG